jgi:hypothetical protein
MIFCRNEFTEVIELAENCESFVISRSGVRFASSAPLVQALAQPTRLGFLLSGALVVGITAV